MTKHLLGEINLVDDLCKVNCNIAETLTGPGCMIDFSTQISLDAGMATAGLEVREAGRALRVQTEAPHLVSMGSGRLSTAVTLHPLPEGKTKYFLTFAS